MTDRSILAVPGLAKTSPEFRAALWEMADRNGWNVDAIATVMSIESAGTFSPSIKNPYGSATGLIQFTENTARILGTTTAELARMTAIEQLAYVEKYYKNARISASARPVDYYVVLVGKLPGLGIGTQVVSDADYAVNKGLDADRDGVITVSDLQTVMQQRASAAHGARVSADPLSETPTDPGSAPPGSASSLLASRSLLVAANLAELNVLRRGDGGPDVAFIQHRIGELKVDGWFGPLTEARVREFQREKDLRVDGVVGIKTWGAMR
jgi:peptidoglycan hydrolase-like protein with peptidoglycan-binding domain